MIALWLVPAFSLSALAPCSTVPHDRVLAGDLAKLEPAFANLSPDLPMTFAPLPGIQRVLSKKDLLTLLRRHGVDPPGSLAEICVERETVPLKEPDLIAAIQSALNIEEVHVRILDYPRRPLPPGTLQFQPGAVTSRPAGSADLPVFWPGRLRYDDAHSVSIWVRAVVWVERQAVVAVEDLAAGKIIESESIRLEQVRAFPLGNPYASGVDKVIGLKPRSLIRKGSPITPAQLELPWTILKGDEVLVRVLAGSTHVSLEAIALGSGRLGDEVALRNPLSGRSFRAVVDAKGVASLKQRGTP